MLEEIGDCGVAKDFHRNTLTRVSLACELSI